MRLQALMSPARPARSDAIVTDDETLSSASFLDRIQQAAGALVGRGVRPGDRVVIVARKCPAVVAAIFACLRERIVLVPVDESAPALRWVRMIEDCRPRAILTDAASRAKLLAAGPPTPGCEIFSVDGGTVAHVAAERSDGNPSRDSTSGASGRELAYVMYTSGSTGLPKGVSVSRDALAAFLTAAIRRASYSEATRFLNFFPLHFDPMLMEIAMPWAVGGTAVLFGKLLAPSDLVRALIRHRITDFSCTPNVFSLLLSPFSGLAQARLDELRSIWFGGEVANVAAVRALRERLPRVRLFNGYGPTETVVACSLHEVTDADLRRGVIPIGTAMDEASFLVRCSRDVYGRHEGTTGELLVGGSQVMEGYWGLPADAAENGFVVVDGKRYFQTGDHVRFEKGVYWFEGRANDMLKVRGYRVFPAEIEAIVNAASDVAESCVVVDEARSRLLCMVVPRDASAPEGVVVGDLLRTLADSLPAYMVPERILVRRELPRTTAGKLDRKRAQELLGACS